MKEGEVELFLYLFKEQATKAIEKSICKNWLSFGFVDAKKSARREEGLSITPH